eukprot:jgi/Chlat1/2313/Chrsp17S00171
MWPWSEQLRLDGATADLDHQQHDRRSAHAKRKKDNLIKLGVGAAVTLLLCAAPLIRPLLPYRQAAPPPPVASTATSTLDQRPTIGDKVSYTLDIFLTTHPLSKAAVLLGVTCLMTVIGATSYRLLCAPDEKNSFPEEVWNSWTMVADPGTHCAETSIRRRVVSVPLTIGGMLFFALLVGLVSDGISTHVDNLRAGGRVIESNHTLVVGWTSQTVQLVDQLTLANASEGGTAIVVLGSEDKAVMDQTLHQAIPNPRKSKLVTRTGDMSCPDDLRKCGAVFAKKVIVLSPIGDKDEADAKVVQACMVLTQLPNLQASITAEFTDVNNLGILQAAHNGLHLPERKIAQHQIVPVAANHMAGRLIVYKACDPGYAAVLKELLGFEGQELYSKHWPELEGKRFDEVAFVFDNAVACGIQRNSGEFLINPPGETVVNKGDNIVVIAEDNNSYSPGSSSMPSTVPPANSPTKNTDASAYTTRKAQSVLICGWRKDIEEILFALYRTIGPGSEVAILSATPISDRQPRLERIRDSAAFNLRNYQASRMGLASGNPVARRELEAVPLEKYDKVLVLGDEGDMDLASSTGADSDSHRMATAMYIKAIQAQRGRHDSRLVAELAHQTGNPILENVRATWLDDYTLPDDLQAMVLANMAEDSQVGRVMSELVTESDRMGIRIRPARAYVREGEELSFWDLLYRGLSKQEVVLGYKRVAEHQGHGADKGWVLNPGQKSEVHRWSLSDFFVVIARK